jgi:hypothetical protein
MTYIAALGLQVDRDNVQYIGTAALRPAATVQAAVLTDEVHKCSLSFQVVLIWKLRKAKT